VVLEPGDGPRRTFAQGALQEDVADHASIAGDGLVGEEISSRHERAVTSKVAAAQELIAAAHGEECRAAIDRRADGGSLGREVRCDELLLAILSTADVDEIVSAWLEWVARADLLDFDRMSAERGPPTDHGNVPTVGVDVQVRRVEMTDRELHGVFPSQ
jgi:hypothetical protein